MLVCPGVNLLSCRMCWMTSCHLRFPFHIIEAQFPWKQTATKIMNSILVLWASGWSLHTCTMRGAIMTHSGGSDESCPGWHKVRKYLQRGINASLSPTNRFCQWSSPPEALEHDRCNCTNMQWNVNLRFIYLFIYLFIFFFEWIRPHNVDLSVIWPYTLISDSSVFGVSITSI